MLERLKRLKLLWASIRLVRDPTRLDEVFDLADGLAATDDLAEMIDAIRQSSPTAARSMVERPRVTVDLAALRALPAGTLGREYADFLDRNGLDPEVFLDRPVTNDADFTLAHLYETHDIWHVVTGFSSDVAGELGLQAFYLAQFPGRLAILLLPLGMLNTLLYTPDDYRPRMSAIAAGWRAGNAAAPLFGIDWSSLWDQPLAAIRARLGVDIAEITGLRAAA